MGEWIPATDQMPEARQRVLILVDNRIDIAEVGIWHVYPWPPRVVFFRDNSQHLLWDVIDGATYWMSLPNPPKVKE